MWTLNQKRMSDCDVLNGLTVVFFCLTYIFLGLTDGLLVARGVDAGNILVRLKYYLMILTVACSLLYAVVHKRFNIFWKETKQLLIIVIVFALISGFEIITVGAYTSDVLDSLIKLALPVLLAYGVLNTLTYRQLQISMVIVLGFSIAGYVCELLFGGFSSASLSEMDYATSSSPTESSIFAGISIILCAFYCYCRNNTVLTVLSTIYAIATFKRLAIIFAIAFFVIPIFVDPNKKVPSYIRQIMKMVFLCGTGIYYLLLLPQSGRIFEELFHQSQDQYTMGRSSFLRTLLSTNYQSYGYGSSAIVIGRSLEMDYLQIAIELTPIALFIFINGYWSILGNNLYLTIFMLFQSFNFLTSHSLNSNYAWGIAFIFIGMVIYMPQYQMNHGCKTAKLEKWSD